EKRKIYTPENRAKLDAKQAKRDAAAEAVKEAERAAKKPEIDALIEKQLIEKGYNQEKIYVVLGNTFAIKDELKAKGAKFSGRFRSWFFTEPTDEFETYELETKRIYTVYPNGTVVENTD